MRDGDITFFCGQGECHVTVGDRHTEAGAEHAAKMQREEFEKGTRDPAEPFEQFLDRYAAWMDEGEQASRLNLSVRDYTAIERAESLLRQYGISTKRPEVLKHVTPPSSGRGEAG